MINPRPRLLRTCSPMSSRSLSFLVSRSSFGDSRSNAIHCIRGCGPNALMAPYCLSSCHLSLHRLSSIPNSVATSTNGLHRITRLTVYDGYARLQSAHRRIPQATLIPSSSVAHTTSPRTNPSIPLPQSPLSSPTPPGRPTHGSRSRTR